MPRRCAILDDYQNVALDMADWSGLRDRIDITVFNAPLGDATAAAEKLRDFEIICAMRERTPFRRELLEQLSNLKLLVTSGMRNASIDLDAARERGILVCGTGGGTDSTAPLTMGLILELTRHIGRESERLKRGSVWQTMLGTEIAGKTLGILGLGKLGGKVARLAQAFEMTVIAWSENLTRERCAELGVTYATREELFAKADIVTIHSVLSKRTRGLVAAADLARMKPTSYLVNTSRGPIVDEDALFAALKAKRIAGAGLDVFSVEPLPLDHPIRNLGNVVLTPHLGYATREMYGSYYGQMVEDIDGWLRGQPINLLN